MRARRRDVLNLNETGELPAATKDDVPNQAGPESAAANVREDSVAGRRTSSSTSVKRPASSDGTNLPALKKRSLNSKKLKKQKSLGKLPFRKSSISKPAPASTATSAPGSPEKRPAATPVYRATPTPLDCAIEQTGGEGGLRSRVQSLESEISSLRAKLRWFEQSYGEIPPNTLPDITQDSPRKHRKSAFKEELGSLRSRGDTSRILPEDVRALKCTAIDPIVEETPSPNVDEFGPVPVAPESTIKLIPPSPSQKSLPASPPRRSPTKGVFSPGQEEIGHLETLSPIHPNIIPALVPRQSIPEMGAGQQENVMEKVHDLAE
jgi:hypothetical protein